jgi:hypothetical protein
VRERVAQARTSSAIQPPGRGLRRKGAPCVVQGAPRSLVYRAARAWASRRISGVSPRMMMSFAFRFAHRRKVLACASEHRQRTRAFSRSGREAGGAAGRCPSRFCCWPDALFSTDVLAQHGFGEGGAGPVLRRSYWGSARKTDFVWVLLKRAKRRVFFGGSPVPGVKGRNDKPAKRSGVGFG